MWFCSFLGNIKTEDWDGWIWGQEEHRFSCSGSFKKLLKGDNFGKLKFLWNFSFKLEVKLRILLISLPRLKSSFVFAAFFGSGTFYLNKNASKIENFAVSNIKKIAHNAFPPPPLSAAQQIIPKCILKLFSSHLILKYIYT